MAKITWIFVIKVSAVDVVVLMDILDRYPKSMIDSLSRMLEVSF